MAILKKFAAVALGLVLMLQLCIALAPSEERGVLALSNQSTERNLADIIGVTNAGALYHFDSDVSVIEEGAEQIKNMGSNVIKLWLNTQCMTGTYRYGTDWTKYDIKTVNDILRTDYYRNVLDMDFSTYVFELNTFDYNKTENQVSWTDGVTDEEYARLADETYEVAAYLLREYVGTGKTFIFQNWEGDNFLGARNIQKKDGYYGFTDDTGAFIETPSEETQQAVFTKIFGLINYVNAMQEGVDRAMAQYGGSDVRVLHCFEANLSRAGNDDGWTYPTNTLVMECVVPYTDCDLYSLSSWSTSKLRNASTLIDVLNIYEKAIGSQYTDIRSDEFDETKFDPVAPYEGAPKTDRRPFYREGQKTKLMLGEFGAPEREVLDNPLNEVPEITPELARAMRQTLQIQIEIGLNYGLEYMLFWELYCNELRSDVGVSLGEQVEAVNESQGAWLIRPDGTYTEGYKYLKGLLKPEEGLTFTQTFEEGKAYEGENSFSVEVKGKLTLPASVETNNKTAFDYGDKIALYGSKDGSNYQPISVVSFFSNVKTDGENKIYDVTFINEEPVDGMRYFKAENKSPSDLSLETIKGYRENNDVLRKIVYRNTMNGDEDVLYRTSSYTLESGDTLEIKPSINDGSPAQFTYSSSNRYIAEVSQEGVVLARVNGRATITITAAVGNETLTAKLDVLVAAQGELLLEDKFSGMTTIGYAEGVPGMNEKLPTDTKLPGFGTHQAAEGYSPKFFDTDNIEFYYNVNEWMADYYGKDEEDRYYAYILDWNERSDASITYYTEEEVGGYDVFLHNYGEGALSRINVYVSADNSNWQLMTSYVSESERMPQDTNYVPSHIRNRQAIPEGMHYVKVEIRYNDVNKWNPQIKQVSIYGESGVDDSFIDSELPTLTVDGSYPQQVKLGTEVEVLPAYYSDNFSTKDEIEYAVNVYLVMDGLETPVTLNNGKFTVNAQGMYRITYTAIDLAGNMAKKDFYIEGVADLPEEDTGGGCSGTVQGVSFAAVGLVAVSGLLLVKRRKKQQ